MNAIRVLLLYIVDLVFGIIEFLLIIRFFLRLLNANPSSTFVSWIYDNTTGLLHPFEGALPTTVLHGQFIVEFSTLLALVVYGFIGYLLITILSRAIPVRRDNA